ncbi:MAG: hypothetical protein NVSMB55_12660 [Mycobacteriales bacterium]
MTQPSLPGLPSRGRTYAFMSGIVVTLLVLAVALPFALGKKSGSDAGGTQSLGQLQPGPGGVPGPSAASLPTALPSGGLVPGGSPAAITTGGGLAGGTTGLTAAGAPPAPGVSGKSGGALGGSRGASNVSRTASDQGVSADSIKLGVFIIDFGGANSLGAGVTGYDPKAQESYVNAYVDDVNAHGGINGRKLVTVERKVDILNQQTMRDACTAFGETDKVFAVAQVLGVYGDPILKCAHDEHLPFLSNDGAVQSYYAAADGNLFTTSPSTRRSFLNLEHELIRLGELKGKKVGVLYEDGYLLPDDQALVAQVNKDLGVQVVEGSLSASDSTLALRQIPTVAQDFCGKGVNYVLMLTNELYGSQFADNVDRNPGCRPSYAISDFDFAMDGDSFLKNMPASFFSRAVSVTSTRNGEGRIGRHEQPVDAACRTAYEASSSGHALDRNTSANSDYFNALAACQVLRTFVQGVTAAGPNPTRVAFRDGLSRVGPFDNAYYGSSSFTTARHDAPQVIRITQAFGSCMCWKPQTDFYPATFR